MHIINKLINSLEKHLKNQTPLLKGSLYETKKKCTYKNCRKCKSGELHYAIQFTFSDKDKGRSTTSIKKRFFKQIKNSWEQYRTINRLTIELKKELFIFLQKINNSNEKRLIDIRDYIKTLKQSEKSID